MRGTNTVSAKFGIDSYTYHRFFGVIRDGEKNPEIRWTVDDLVSEVSTHQPDVVCYQVMFLPDRESADWTLARNALVKGPPVILAWGGDLGLDGGRASSRFDDLLGWAGEAADLGGSFLRIVVGGPRTQREVSWSNRLVALTPLLRTLVERAGDIGIRIAIETHADLTPQQLCELLDAVNDDRLDVVLDVANLTRVDADIVSAAALFRGRVPMVHLRDVILTDPNSFDGETRPCLPPGSGELDLTGFIAALGGIEGYEGLLAVELVQLHERYAGREHDAVSDGLAWLRHLNDQGVSV